MMSPTDLPIMQILPQLCRSLEQTPNAVLVAPPGAGKTTSAPLALLDAEWRGNDRIIMLEPRRLAARAAASRMAFLRGEPIGETIGFRTRLETATSPRTRIEVITEGMLVRRMQSDPGLEGVAAVIFDEVHERSLDLDLALALCLDLQRELRPELRLIAMSATADVGVLSALLSAPVLESAGRMFPVKTYHAERDIASARDLPDAMARAVRSALSEHEGDVLAFLPGMGEIRRAQSALEACGAIVLPLHGDLPPAEQDRALRPDPERRRVVLATSIAETSLTVPGVRIVIDGGWRRSPQLDPSTGLTQLVTRRISRAAADQRAGRAGREAAGVAIRLWSAAQHRGLPPFDRPEILDAELSGFCLDCAAWGTPPDQLPFPDQPPSGATAAAAALLEELGALDAGRITTLGRSMAKLGAHPRLAAMMLAAENLEEAALAADIAALLEDRDPLSSGADAAADIGLRLQAIAHGAPDVDRGALSRIRRAAGQYRRRLRTSAEPSGDPARLIAAAFPDRIAQRRSEPGSFRLSGGGSATLARGDRLSGLNLLAVAALETRSGARIKLAAPLDLGALPPAIAAKIVETVECDIDPATGSVMARRRRKLGALILEERSSPADPAETAIVLAGVVGGQMHLLPWSDAARQFQSRVMRMRPFDETLPDLSDDALKQSITDWLGPHLHGVTRLSAVADIDLFQILRSQLDWSQVSQLDRELPASISLPGGVAKIDYTEPVPLASARAQHFYGLRETPTLAGGRVPLRVALLSPAGRPAAITADLANFWKGAWLDMRKEMRGRYPKHNWPENPGGS